jgi:uncharacterized protein
MTHPDSQAGQPAETGERRDEVGQVEVGQVNVFRPGGVSYLRIPARDAGDSAAFYQAVFGWTLRGDPDEPSFADGSGHVIGHWMTELAAVGEAGVMPYIYVDRIDDSLRLVTGHGGEVVTEPYPEGGLWVATFRDPAGNVIGVWQQGPRD